MSARFPIVTRKSIGCSSRSLKAVFSAATRRSRSLTLNIARTLGRLAAVEIGTEGAQKTGQLNHRTNTEVYVRDGLFNLDRIFEVFDKLGSGNAKEGSRPSRIVWRMAWVAETSIVCGPVVEFESRVNLVWSRHDDAVAESHGEQRLVRER